MNSGTVVVGTDRFTSITLGFLMAACPVDAGAIQESLEREIQKGPDFTRCRRGSDFRQPPKVNTDRNFLARLMFMADMIERKTWRGRARGKHGGTLGRSALTLLRGVAVRREQEGRLSGALL
jgi:hypothetical protein